MSNNLPPNLAHLKDLDQCEDLKFQNIGNRPHPKADSVINRAHRDAADRGLYLVGSRCRVDQYPNDSNKNMAGVWVEATFHSIIEDGVFVFEGCADADPSNTTQGSTANALVRMAHTRALGRALSLALNIDEALAEEIAEGSTAAAGGNSGGGSSNSGGVSSNTGGKPDWMYKIPMGRNKDKRIDDPTVDVSDLEWFIANNKLNKKNPQTNNYDLPDPERIALFQAEIAKRKGQSPPDVSNNNDGPPSESGGWKASPANISYLVGLGNKAGKNYAALKQECVNNFSKADPPSLTQDEFSTLCIMLGGEPV